MPPSRAVILERLTGTCGTLIVCRCGDTDGYFDRLAESGGVGGYRVVCRRSRGDFDAAVNGEREHKPLVVVGVLADQVDPPGRTSQHACGSAKSPLKRVER